MQVREHVFTLPPYWMRDSCTTNLGIMDGELLTSTCFTEWMAATSASNVPAIPSLTYL